MKGNFNTQLGEIFIDPKVIATYAGSVAVECAGIVGMALVNMTQGVVRLLRRDAWTKGTRRKNDKNKRDYNSHYHSDE